MTVVDGSWTALEPCLDEGGRPQDLVFNMIGNLRTQDERVAFCQLDNTQIPLSGEAFAEG